MQQGNHKLYALRKPQSPWGDYGDILLHGMTKSAPAGSALLMRTGPFAPPISPPAFTVIGPDTVRGAMEPQKFTGFEFSPVSKHHIVRLDWRGWDPAAPDPAEFPD